MPVESCDLVAQTDQSEECCVYEDAGSVSLAKQQFSELSTTACNSLFFHWKLKGGKKDANMVR